MNHTRCLKASEQPLARRYALALLDLDGVVYRGDDPVVHASEGIAKAQSEGMRPSYTTNNPSRFPDTVAEQLRGLGVDADGSDIITSAIVAARMLTHHLATGAKVLIVGAEHLRDEVRKSGFEVVDDARAHPGAVLQSWHKDLSFDELAQAAYAIEQGAEYYVTNRDMTIPREQGIAPGNGAMQLPIIETTGKHPLDSAGKPESAMYDEARTLFSHTDQPIPGDVCLPVGDRLDTDIEAANRGDYDSLVVLTGVATPRMIMTASSMQRPTFIARDLLGLDMAHPAATRLGEGEWRCRGCVVRRTGTRFELDASDEAMGSYDGLDALRAASCAVWEAMDGGMDANLIDVTSIERAIDAGSRGE
ncbi:HAD-IIA family hydrolase [Bifidobacterium sp.]|uniref:HAD-IIA family hydrolase n=1 Tax=Bifidobacterium sp. TaxID=41200 RepID=UPI0039EC2DD9